MEAFLLGIFRGIIAAAAIIAILFTLNCILMELKRKDSCSESGMRVIKKGKIPTKKVECLHCHSIIEYDTMKVEHQPIMDTYYPYIVCPICNEQIVLGREKGGEG